MEHKMKKAATVLLQDEFLLLSTNPFLNILKNGYTRINIWYAFAKCKIFFCGIGNLSESLLKQGAPTELRGWIFQFLQIGRSYGAKGVGISVSTNRTLLRS